MSYGVGAPGYHQGPPRAVEHPSAHTALVLALFGTFCLGAVTGVPAILLGRRALGAIALEPRRWSGGGTARTAIVFGWLSVLETAFVVTLGLAREFVGASLGLTVGLGGLVLVALSEVDSLPLRALRKARFALGVPLVGVLVASALGLSVAFAKDAAVTQRCELARAQYPVALKSESFGAARSYVDDLQLDCKAPASEVATLRQEIAAKEAELTRRKAQEDADRVAALAASFPIQGDERGGLEGVRGAREAARAAAEGPPAAALPIAGHAAPESRRWAR